jgi:hypothetical protein
VLAIREMLSEEEDDETSSLKGAEQHQQVSSLTKKANLPGYLSLSI